MQHTSSLRPLRTFALALLALACSPDLPGPTGLAAESEAGFEPLVRRGRTVGVRGRFPTPTGAPSDARARDFVERNREALGLVGGIELEAPTTAGERIETVVFPLSIGGVPIHGGEVRVRLTPDFVFYVRVVAPETADVETTPTLDSSAAETAALARVPGASTAEPPELVVYSRALARGVEGAPRLAWRVGMNVADAPSSPELFVDARDGAELERVERAVRVTNREVWDAHSRYIETGQTQLYAESGPLVAMPDAEAALAFEYAGLACSYLESTFSEDAPCNPLNVLVRYGNDPDGSVYDAHEPDPRMPDRRFGKVQLGPGVLVNPSDAGRPVTERQGYATFMHEVGHALVHQRADVWYGGEHGAVSEALADLLSAFATRRARWEVLRFDGGLERDLEDPSRPGPDGPYPTTYATRRPTDYDVDNGNTHYNSLILSHAVWRATRGGVAACGATIPPIGEEKMEQIVYEVLAHYLGRYSMLEDTAVALVDACMRFALLSSLFGQPTHDIDARDCAALRTALSDAGLAIPDSDLDSWPDDHDNCPTVGNPTQANADRDALGDACDPDAPPPAPLPFTTCTWTIPGAHCLWFSTDGCTLQGGAPFHLVGDPTSPTIVVDRPGDYRSMHVIDSGNPDGAVWLFSLDSDGPLPGTIQYGDYCIPGTRRGPYAIPEPLPLVVGRRYEIDFFATQGGSVTVGAELVLGAGHTTDACTESRP